MYHMIVDEIRSLNCDHKGTTIAWGENADKCTKCDLTWDV